MVPIKLYSYIQPQNTVKCILRQAQAKPRKGKRKYLRNGEHKINYIIQRKGNDRQITINYQIIVLREKFDFSIGISNCLDQFTRFPTVIAMCTMVRNHTYQQLVSVLFRSKPSFMANLLGIQNCLIQCKLIHKHSMEITIVAIAVSADVAL